MTLTKINGTKIFYQKHGTGREILVLIHGFGGESHEWREVIDALPHGYSVYTLDMRGFGRSNDAHQNITLKQWADDIYNFSRQMNLPKFNCVGIDMGGAITIRLAITHPEILKSIILVNSVPACGSTVPEEWVERARINFHNRSEIKQNVKKLFLTGISEQRLDEYVDNYMTVNKEAYFSWLNSESYVNQEKYLGEINVPTLMVIGGKDSVSSPEGQLRTSLQIPNTRAVLLNTEGHMIAIESPQKLVYELVSYLKKCL
jgi:pimeloyl-ACP methyl ester carboxylesterase